MGEKRGAGSNNSLGDGLPLIPVALHRLPRTLEVGISGVCIDYVLQVCVRVCVCASACACACVCARAGACVCMCV